jgi:serine/threonine protein kinase
VYEGVRIEDGNKVAVKKIPKINVAHMEGRVPLEVTLLKKVEDVPGVVHIIECFDMGDSFAIVFENDGIYKDLFDIILEKGKLEENLTRNVFHQVVETVIMCHKRGVLHRDIKDENIIINIKTFEAKLIYFGSGCPVKDSQYKDFEGTPVYAPPEWVENKSYLAEDMGILLFDMVCGNVPFMEERQIVEGKLEWVSDVSVELRDLIGRECH